MSGTNFFFLVDADPTKRWLGGCAEREGEERPGGGGRVSRVLDVVFVFQGVAVEGVAFAREKPGGGTGVIDEQSYSVRKSLYQ